MSNVPVFVGLDYHQDSIQVCVVDQQGKMLLNRRAGNDCQEIGGLVNALGQVQHVGIEACCGAADFSQELTDQLGWRVSLGHPAYVAKLKRSPDKSDYSDGRLLADLTRVGYLPKVWLPPASIRELRQLVNHRQRLVDRKRSLKLQVGAILREQRVKIPKDRGSRWSKAWTLSGATTISFPAMPAGLSTICWTTCSVRNGRFSRPNPASNKQPARTGWLNV